MAGLIQEAVSQVATNMLNKSNVRDYMAACRRIEQLHTAGKLSRNDVASFAAATGSSRRRRRWRRCAICRSKRSTGR